MAGLRQAFKQGSAVATGANGFCLLGVTSFPVPYGVVVGGTFVGTVKVEVSDDPDVGSPTWTQFGSDITAPGTVKVDIPVKAVRLRCSAYTSGTIMGYIGASDVG